MEKNKEKAHATNEGKKGKTEILCDYKNDTTKTENCQEENLPVNTEYVWTLLSTYEKKGKDDIKYQQPYQTINNFLIVLQNDNYFKGKFKYNQLSQRREVSISGRIESYDDTTESTISYYFERNYFLTKKAALLDALNIAFKDQSYHPVQDYLKSLKWDGIARLHLLMIKYLGAEDTPYTHEITRLMMVGAVNRAVNPGCKIDNVIVLMGNQGTGKSSFISKLAINEDWYKEVSTIKEQKGIESISGGWLCELSELNAIKNEKDLEEVKAYTTRLNDDYRKPYDKYPTRNPRQCIFIGTTNNPMFLTDKTGNRRFFPIKTNGNASALFGNEEELKTEFSQIWAEAMQLYKQGSPTIFNEALKVELDSIRESATQDDYRIGMIQEYLDSHKNIDYVCCRIIWNEILDGKDGKAQEPKHSTDISLIMNNHINGWRRIEKYRYKGEFAKYGVQQSWERIKLELVNNRKAINTNMNINDFLIGQEVSPVNEKELPIGF